MATSKKTKRAAPAEGKKEGRRKDEPPSDESCRTAEHYTEGILTRGEAAEPGEPLGPGQTHVKVEDKKDGKPKVQRRRFSITGG